MDDSSALAFYSWYTLLVYVASIPGGLLADKLWGQKRTILISSILLCIGYSLLTLGATWTFYSGIGFIVLGVGGLKPNISAMVGGLYSKKDGRRDSGYYIFYLSINIGAAVSAILVGYVGGAIGWQYGFGLAAAGMIVGLMVYLWGQKYLVGIGEAPQYRVRPKTESNFFFRIFKYTNSSIATLSIALVGIFIWVSFGLWDYGLLLLGLSIAIGIAFASYSECDKIERDRMKVIYLSFFIIIVFWGAFEQVGGLMYIYTDRKIDRVIGSFEVPLALFQSLSAIFILILSIPIAAFWVWWRRRGREASSLLKMAVGVVIMGLGFLFMALATTEVQINAAGELIQKSSMTWLILAYLFHTVGELCASPIALSFISKLAPARYLGFMMGLYFAVTGLGNKVAGLFGENMANFGEYEQFIGITVFCILFGSLIITLLKPLKRLTHGAEEVTEYP